MPKLSEAPVKLKSLGYNLWKAYESNHGPITLDEIAKATKLKLSTVRALVAKSERNKDVYTNAVGPAYVLATFFEVTIEKMIVEASHA